MQIKEETIADRRRQRLQRQPASVGEWQTRANRISVVVSIIILFIVLVLVVVVLVVIQKQYYRDDIDEHQQWLFGVVLVAVRAD